MGTTRPDLQSVIANLVEDHQMIAAIVNSVRMVSAEAGGAASDRAETIGREPDGLAAIVESHFGYEERAISAALDRGVHDNGWSKPTSTSPRSSPGDDPVRAAPIDHRHRS